MNRDLWKDVNRIFHSALEVEPSRRREFVLAQANCDSELQAEVEKLLQANADAGSYLENPPNFAGVLSGHTHFVVVGDVLCGRFRIVREIAEGGMGQVFEAFDIELAVRVALKVIRPEIASNPEAIARFRQEVRLARSITHPNICRTFDLERETRIHNDRLTEIVFLTMEFLPGETLSSRIKRTGSIPLAETLALASQIAAALKSAHNLGITHRDMKPANIMLVAPETSQQGLRAVVTDFGLARLNPLLPADGLSAFSKTGHPIGTLAYMAPEQLAGNTVSPATDIYAFGLILFEMITGERVFPSDNPLSGIAQRLQDRVPLERLLPQSSPTNWRLALEQCLAVKPSDRPKDANDVIGMLENGRHRFLPYLRRSDIAARRFLPHLSIIVAVFLLAVALSVGALRLYQPRADSVVASGALVYLAPVENKTGEKQLDNVTELVRAGLSQSAHINLMDNGRVGDLLHDMTKPPNTFITPPIAREIALRAGATRVVIAAIAKSFGSYRLHVEIQQPDPRDPSRSRESWSKEFDWTNDLAATSESIPVKLASAIRNSTDWIRFQVGESKSDIIHLNSSPEDVTTSSWQALTEYVGAEDLQTRGDTAKAVVALQNAVTIDPHFSLAFGRLGDLLFSTSQYEDGLRAYTRALDPDQDRRLTRRERDSILGEFSLDSAEYAAAEKAYRDLTLFYPNDYKGWSYRGYPLLMMGRTEEAFNTLNRAYSMDPGKLNAPYELARANISAGTFSDALRWAEVLSRQGYPELADYIQGVVQYLLHDYPNANKRFIAMQQTKRIVLRSWSYELLARIASEQGDDSSALKTLQAGIDFDHQNGQQGLEANLLIARAFIEANTGQNHACIHDVRTAVDLEGSSRRLMVASSVLGVARSHAHAPDSAVLRDEILELEKRLPPDSFGAISDLARFRIRGEALLAAGDAKGATVQFRKAGELDAPSNGREYLARALDIAAQREVNPASALKLRRSAMDAYAATALRPNLLWLDSVDVLPGYYVEQLIAYLRLAEITPGNEQHAAIALQDLKALRGPVSANFKTARGQSDFQQPN